MIKNFFSRGIKLNSNLCHLGEILVKNVQDFEDVRLGLRNFK